MIHTLGNVDCFELCEISPKFNVIVAWRLEQKGSFIVTVALCWLLHNCQKINGERFNAFTISNFGIMNGRSRRALYGKSEAKREYLQAKLCWAQERVQNHSSTSTTVWNSSKLTVEYRTEWRVLQARGGNCARWPPIRRYLARTTKARKGEDILCQQPRTGGTIEVQTWLPGSRTKNREKPNRKLLRLDTTSTPSFNRISSSTTPRKTIPAGKETCSMVIRSRDRLGCGGHLLHHGHRLPRHRKANGGWRTANDVGNGEETGTGNTGKHRSNRSTSKSNDICGRRKIGGNDGDYCERPWKDAIREWEDYADNIYETGSARPPEPPVFICKNIPSVDKLLRFDYVQSFGDGIHDIVKIRHGFFLNFFFLHFFNLLNK